MPEEDKSKLKQQSQQFLNQAIDLYTKNAIKIHLCTLDERNQVRCSRVVENLFGLFAYTQILKITIKKYQQSELLWQEIEQQYKVECENLVLKVVQDLYTKLNTHLEQEKFILLENQKQTTFALFNEVRDKNLHDLFCKQLQLLDKQEDIVKLLNNPFTNEYMGQIQDKHLAANYEMEKGNYMKAFQIYDELANVSGILCEQRLIYIQHALKCLDQAIQKSDQQQQKKFVEMKQEFQKFKDEVMIQLDIQNIIKEEFPRDLMKVQFLYSHYANELQLYEIKLKILQFYQKHQVLEISQSWIKDELLQIYPEILKKVSTAELKSKILNLYQQFNLAFCVKAVIHCIEVRLSDTKWFYDFMVDNINWIQASEIFNAYQELTTPYKDHSGQKISQIDYPCLAKFLDWWLGQANSRNKSLVLNAYDRDYQFVLDFKSHIEEVDKIIQILQSLNMEKQYSLKERFEEIKRKIRI